jgi:Flp pilus assembly pilin Flp
MRNALRSRLVRFQLLLQAEEGQSLAEWAMILCLVTVVCVAILGTISGSLNSMLNSISRGF